MSEEYKRMQVKVLYSFNNNTEVFLSRSKQMHSIKTIQIPMANDELITLGAFDLKTCVQQVLKSSPENFRLNSEDYAVYYKDITEQPDEPFVANGVLSGLVNTSKQHLIPGRVCQNLSASFLFGDKGNSSSHTLEIRLKLHTIEKTEHETQQPPPQQSQQQKQMSHGSNSTVAKRSSSFIEQQSSLSQIAKKPRQKYSAPTPASSTSTSSSSNAAKATRTKSLPIFYPQNQQIFNIINADKSNAPSKYDNKSVQDRFKLAPFLLAKILENPQKKNKITPINQNSHSNINNSISEPQRAMRTRSMVTNRQMPLIISSPINEETDASDTDYQDTNMQSEVGDMEEDEEAGSSSPYTPQQPPYSSHYNQIHQHTQAQAQTQSTSSATFQSLPDLEDLDSRKTHAIPHFRLPKNHGLVCMNSNCATSNSITWRYFETGYHPNYLSLHRTRDFDMKHYEGMIGPLCNACYLFLRNKGFMRPEAVVKKYMQQQRYKELKQKDEQILNMPKQYASSPPVFHKFTTPSHTPSAINQVIQMQHSTSTAANNNNNNTNTNNNNLNSSNRPTPNYLNFNELNDFMNQLNSFGGPLTDMDPLADNQTLGVTPPMMATKSNTRIINLYDDVDDDDKENHPPPVTSDDAQHLNNELDDFESIIVKSFSQSSDKNSPNKALSDQQAASWMSNIFGEPTPKDQITPKDTNRTTMQTPSEFKEFSKSMGGDETESEEDDTLKNHPNLPQLRTFTTHKSSSPLRSQKTINMVSNMPSSPLMNHPETDNFVEQNSGSSPTSKAGRVDTTTLIMSTIKGEGIEHGSTPNTDFFSNDDLKEHCHEIENESHMGIEKIH